MIVGAVEYDDKEGENKENVRCHRHICEILEGSEPANRDKDKGCDENIKAFNVALVVKCLKADHLIHLLADKDQVRDSKA